MYIHPILVGIAIALLSEVVIVIAVVVYQTKKWNKKDEATESTN